MSRRARCTCMCVGTVCNVFEHKSVYVLLISYVHLKLTYVL